MRQISLSQLATDVIFRSADVTEAHALPLSDHVGRYEVGKGEQQTPNPHKNHPHANEQRFAGGFPDEGDQGEGGDEAEVVCGGDVAGMRSSEAEPEKG